MNRKALVVLLIALSGVAAALADSAWTVVPSPNRGTVSSQLNGVGLTAANNVWAAGHSYDSQLASYRTLVERWDGTRWTIAPTPNATSGYNDLNAIAMANQSDGWAVGYSQQSTYGPSHTLILHWDGLAWRLLPSPNPGPGNNVLYSVAAESPGNAWAVGWYYDAQFIGRPLILHWNGLQWLTVPAPSASTYFNALQTVAATGPADAWAAGYAYVSGRYSTFVEHWNGSAWTIVASPNVGTSANRIRAISGSSADDVWAVGDSGSAGSLVEHWNGLIWTVVSHPEPTSGARTLWGVKALQPNDAWAAGYVNSPASGLQPMIQHWDGASWQLQSTAAPAGSWLTAVSGLPAGDLWTVGATGAATLTLRLDR